MFPNCSQHFLGIPCYVWFKPQKCNKINVDQMFEKLQTYLHSCSLCCRPTSTFIWWQCFVSHGYYGNIENPMTSRLRHWCHFTAHFATYDVANAVSIFVYICSVHPGNYTALKSNYTPSKQAYLACTDVTARSQQGHRDASWETKAQLRTIAL